MSAICPNGHASESTDYCDVCGEPMGAASSASAAVASGSVGAAAGAAGTGRAAAGGEPITCPHCSFPAAAGALFCENCGYDFTTGSLPEPAGAPSAATPGSVGTAAPGPLDPPASSLDLDPVAPPAGSPAAAPSADPLSAPAALTPPVGDPEAGDSSSAPVAGGDPGTGPLVAPGDPGAPTGPAEGEAASARTGATPSGTGTHLPTPHVPGEDQWVVEVWIDPDWYQAQKAEDPLPSAGLPGLVVLRERSVLVGRPSVSRNIHPQIDCGADTGVSRRHCQLNTDGQRWWVEDLQSSNGTYLSPAGGELPIDPIPAGQRREVADGDRIYLGGWTRLVIRKALPGEV
ncbi:FHA domain-containing protein [Oerskovia rustica]|uniref:FHA domain-containing protein n=1 Tax=Oerskovia rustica TaxID=2762237 RepID=A0ABR8RSL6_9CELL|nr:FHA domain-containing protein [Oerskovia rustica]MBD7950799.1 FHA domain-containing protein [Oerskovia rustica]